MFLKLVPDIFCFSHLAFYWQVSILIKCHWWSKMVLDRLIVFYYHVRYSIALGTAHNRWWYCCLQLSTRPTQIRLSKSVKQLWGVVKIKRYILLTFKLTFHFSAFWTVWPRLLLQSATKMTRIRLTIWGIFYSVGDFASYSNCCKFLIELRGKTQLFRGDRGYLQFKYLWNV